MPRRCCVPCCKSNYDSANRYTSVFHFPKDEQRRTKWIQSINRKDFVPSSTAVICINHFCEEFIIREDKIQKSDGTEVIIPRERPTLTSNSYPTIFPNQPKYLTTTLPQKRKTPSERSNEIQQRDEQKFKKWCTSDIISSLQMIMDAISTHITPDWFHIKKDNFVLLYKITYDETPQIYISLKVCSDLSVTVVHNKANIDVKATLGYILGNDLRCDRWTKFDCIISVLNSYSPSFDTTEMKLSAAADMLENCDISNSENMYFKITFLTEQIRLLLMNPVKYSASMLLWASKLYFSNPAGYKLLRNSNAVTVPHPGYLSKLCKNFDGCDDKAINSHVNYLKKKYTALEKHERIVNVLLDEIYITPSMNFKGGNIVGIAENTNLEASTIQCFMIESLLSKNKDVVALVPVRNMTAADLHRYTGSVLKLLYECGYSVLSLISDNNRVNRNMFTIFCDGKMKSSIDHPFEPNNRLFFLFDTVHLLKSLRNNWLNNTCTNQTFFYPSVTDHCQIYISSLQHLRTIYDLEKPHIVKQAPKLTQKVLFPSSTERQNVKHAVNLFHDSNLVSLELYSSQFGNDFLQTKQFMTYIALWWKVVNVKHPLKGKKLRDQYQDPVRKTDDHQVVFLKEFSAWLEAWNKLSQLPAHEKLALNVPTKGGMLSKETAFALKHTTDALVEIINYAFQNLSFKYVLLGKFQTDSLEARFGQYRQLSGGNYHVALRQVFESEHKLKILNLIELQSQNVGKFNLKDLICNSDVDEGSVEIPESFNNVISSDSITIQPSVMTTLVYISGYVARTVARKIKCKECCSVISSNRKLECEFSSDDVSQYLQLTDRGGLTWPTEFTCRIVVVIFMVFQELLKEKYEESFLKLCNHRQVLVQLATYRNELLFLDNNIKCICGLSKKNISIKCLHVMANILLNNYCKAKNDKLDSKRICNKRKLLTVNKQQVKGSNTEKK